MNRRRTAFRHGLFCNALALGGALGALGQVPAHRYEALTRTLGLSDFQLSRANGIALDDSQRRKLAAIREVLDRRDAAAFSVAFGLIDETRWPGVSLCTYYPVRAYAYPREIGLSETQAQRLEQMKEAAQAKGLKIRHDSALAVLDGAQRANLAAFESALELASEAIELKLIATPEKGEIRCH